MKKISFQGKKGELHKQDICKFFGEELEEIPCETFSGVFDWVSDGTADFGIVPVENSFQGNIINNYKLLLESDLWLVGEIKSTWTGSSLSNTTRSFVISPRIYQHPGNNKISLVFAPRHYSSALDECWEVFTGRRINPTLIKLGNTNKYWENVFYIDFKGSLDLTFYIQAIVDLLKRAAFVKILGSYQAAG